MHAKRDALRIVGVTLAIMFLVVGESASSAQKKKVNVDTLTRETQRTSSETERVSLVWWVPEEYWQTSLAEDPNATPSQIEQFVGTLRPYTIFIIVDGKLGTSGSVTYRSEEEIRKNIRLTDSDGVDYPPLSPDEVDAGTKNLLLVMKPVLANVLGPLGQNMYFVLFPAKNKTGKRIAEAAREGAFALKLAEAEYKWKLPLESFLPLEASREAPRASGPKICPVDGAQMDGAWTFCPVHGEKLIVSPPSKICPVDGAELNGAWKFCPVHGEKLVTGKL